MQLQEVGNLRSHSILPMSRREDLLRKKRMPNIHVRSSTNTSPKWLPSKLRSNMRVQSMYKHPPDTPPGEQLGAVVITHVIYLTPAAMRRASPGGSYPHGAV